MVRLRAKKIALVADDIPLQKVHGPESGDLLVLSSEGGNYTTLLLRSGESFTVRATLKGWEQRLPGETFVRVHRTRIINLLEIRQLWNEAGAVYIELSGIVDPIRVSRSRVVQVKRLLERHSLGLQDDG
jgi:DNA-binding LytR/AlgR family response regulator